MELLTTTDTNRKFIRFNLLDEVTKYQEGAIVPVDSCWYQIGELEKDPDHGWRVPLEPTEMPAAGVAFLSALNTKD